MDNIEKLKQDLLACNKCQLNKLRGFGYGNIDSKIMFLAQNPGRQSKNSTTKSEDIIPFSLNEENPVFSGIWFRKLLDHFSLTNDDFYITNVIKCPREDSNDPPTQTEADNCRPFLEREFALQNPKIIIGLGSPSRNYLGLKRFGEAVNRDGIWILSAWHPGRVLREPKLFKEWMEQLSKLQEILDEKPYYEEATGEAFETTTIYDNRRENRQKIDKDFEGILEESGSSDVEFYSQKGTLLAKGYTRMVYGDHGPYIEMLPEHINKEEWELERADVGYYNICKPSDGSYAKLYHQTKTVKNLPNPPEGKFSYNGNRSEGYADYRVDRLYLSPYDILLDKPESDEPEEEETIDCDNFVHLHVHDEYSLLDGFAKVEDYAAEAKRRGWKYLAVTNHGMMGQIPRQYKACVAAGIKPIFGCEVYVNDHTVHREYMTKKAAELRLPSGYESLDELREKIRRNYHIVLLAKNNVGFKNLLQITSDAWINGYYRRPRATHSFIEEHSEGLICGTACMSGPISQFIMRDDMDAAYQAAEYYKEVFGEDLFIEIMLLDLPEQYEINKGLIKIARDLDIDLVVTNDCHYIHEEDSQYQDILLLMQNGRSLRDLESGKNVFQFGSKDLWFKTAEELDETRKAKHQYISDDLFQKMKATSLKIAAKCEVEIDTSLKLPKFTDEAVLAEYGTTDKYLEHLAREGMEWRRLVGREEYEARLAVELDVIKTKQFSNYFLIVKDLTDFSRENDIEVGPGRGSAAGSLLCYCLGITDVDPIQHGLFFERFLNVERKDIPDIDIDFAPSGRDKIKQFIIDKYGQEHVCSIGTYGSFQTRATVLDVCRVFDVPLHISRQVSKSLSSDIDDMDWDVARDHEFFKETFDMLDNEDYVRDIRGHRISPLQAIGRIRFKQKNMSSHAAGVIISNVNLQENLPLMTRDGTVLSSWIEGKKGTELSAFGFVKWDILGLLNLIYIRDALALIKKRHGKTIDVHDIDEDLNDSRVYEDLKRGQGSMIFQFESPLMRKLLKDSKCDNFDTLAAITALGRPGPLQSGMTKDFCERKLGRQEYEIHPVLEPILNYTYGIVVYQEQIMQIVNTLAGYSLAETDMFRKVLIKVKKDTKDDMWKKLEVYRKRFYEGGRQYMEQEELETLFEGFLKWAGYGFNKAHAVAYTIISYRCAWLKTYYPIEYFCAVLRNTTKGEVVTKGRKRNKYEQYVYEAQRDRFQIKTLPPDINKSREDFMIVDDHTLRIGFSNLKGVGYEAAVQIVKNRPEGGYTSFTDFFERNKTNKRVVMPLINIGAFDCLCNRAEALITFYKLRKDKLENEYKRFERNVEANAADVVAVTYMRFIKCVSQSLEKKIKDIVLDEIDFSKYDLDKKTKSEFFDAEFGFSLEHPFLDDIEKRGLTSVYSQYDRIADLKAHEDLGGSASILCEIRDAHKLQSKYGRDYYHVSVEDGGSADDSLEPRTRMAAIKGYEDELARDNIVVARISYYPRYSNYVIESLMSSEGLIDRIKIMTAMRELYIEKVGKKELLNSCVDVYSMKYKEKGILVGVIRGIEEMDKKVKMRIEDEKGWLEVFYWRKNNKNLDKLMELSEDDFVALRFERDEFEMGQDKRKIVQYMIHDFRRINQESIFKKMKEMEDKPEESKRIVRRKAAA